MIDPATFNDGEAAPANERALPDSVTSAPLDCDGNPVMPPWSSSDETVRRYNLQTAAWRARRSREWVEEEVAKFDALAKPSRKGVSSKKFSTQYAVAWCKRQPSVSGCFTWHIIDRENWSPDYKNQKQARSYDLMLGLDVLADDGGPGMQGIQAGTPGEEKAHARTFLERGGPAKAAQRFIKVHWMAFERGKAEPVEHAIWTEDYLRARFPDLFGPAKLLEL